MHAPALGRIGDGPRRRRQVGLDGALEVEREGRVRAQVRVPVARAPAARSGRSCRRRDRTTVSIRRGCPLRAPVVVMSIVRSRSGEDGIDRERPGDGLVDQATHSGWAFVKRSRRPGASASRAGGRIGRRTRSPPQFGQMPAKRASAQSAQNVHS